MNLDFSFLTLKVINNIILTGLIENIKPVRIILLITFKVRKLKSNSFSSSNKMWNLNTFFY